MPHTTDDRNLAFEDGPANLFLIEAPKILDTATAPGNDDHIHWIFHLLQAFNRRRNFIRRTITLDAHRNHQHIGRRPTARQHLQEVSNRCAGRTGNDGNTFGIARNRLFGCWIKQTFFLKFLFELPKGEFQRANADRLHLLNDQLITAALRIDVDATAADKFLPIFNLERQPSGGCSPDDAIELSRFVLEVEVEMARLRCR